MTSLAGRRRAVVDVSGVVVLRLVLIAAMTSLPAAAAGGDVGGVGVGGGAAAIATSGCVGECTVVRSTLFIIYCIFFIL